MNCSDCDSSGLDSPNSRWSIARLKEYLRRKERPSKRGERPSFLNVIISTDIVTSNPSLFVRFFVLFLFFISFSFLFLSCLLCPILLIYRNAARGVLLYFFCNPVWMHTACWPTSRVGRSIGGSFTNFTSLALQPPTVFRQLSIESGFIIWANGSQVHAFSQGRAFLCHVVHAYSIGDRRTETSSCGRKKKKKKKYTDGTASAFTMFTERLAFLALP